MVCKYKVIQNFRQDQFWEILDFLFFVFTTRSQYL